MNDNSETEQSSEILVDNIVYYPAKQTFATVKEIKKDGEKVTISLTEYRLGDNLENYEVSPDQVEIPSIDGVEAMKRNALNYVAFLETITRNLLTEDSPNIIRVKNFSKPKK